MKRLLSVIIISIFTLGSLTLSAQDDDVTILTIGDQTFSLGEFWHVYNKNQHLSSFKETPEEFAERFINYKLKVVEAKSQGLDTLESFINEYQKYVDELKPSFLVDSSAIKERAAEAYSHMKQILNASHILVRVSRNAEPADTLEAYKKITEVYQKAKAGDDFENLAVSYSEDPSVSKNKGRLGYFSAFKMIYPFEKAAFNTPVGDISDIIRTDYGYHIIKVHEKRPNLGSIRVAHIMKVFNSSVSVDSAKIAIDSIYQELLNGASFEKMAALHSDDKYSSDKGGEMRPFSLPQMDPEFAFAAFDLEADGDVSEPVKSEFGWHIIKRLEYRPIGSFEQEYDNIYNLMSRDGRNSIGTESFISDKIQSDNYMLDQDVLDLIYSFSKDAANNEEFFLSITNREDTIITYYNDVLTVDDFVNHLKEDDDFNVNNGRKGINESLDDLSYDFVLSIEKRDLAKNNLKYKYLINEYFDGLLIFEISNNEIWSDVTNDTLALLSHYKNNLEEYTPAPVLKGVVCEVFNKKLDKRVSKLLVKEEGNANLVQILMDKARKDADYKCEEGEYSFSYNAGMPVDKDVLPDDSVLKHYSGSLYWEGEIINSEPLPYEQVQGKVMNSFQMKKESDWVLKLREKYQPVFNYDIINK